MINIMAIGVLKSKMSELTEEMQDNTKTPVEVLAAKTMYEYLNEAVKVLNSNIPEDHEKSAIHKMQKFKRYYI